MDHLHLTEVSLEEAVDPRLNLAQHAVRAHLDRLKLGLSLGLAPLLAASECECCGQTLVTRLLGPHNYFVIGPSGLGKSFHLQHLAYRAGRQAEVPLLIETRYYSGELNRTLHKAISPFTDSDPGTFFDLIRLCGLRPLLLLDGLNEVRERLVPDLLKDLLAVQLRHSARLVCASQTDLQFPGGLAFHKIHLSPLRREHQRAIYCFHARLDQDGAGIDHLCSPFQTAYDLKVAGHCHDGIKERVTRTALYDRYCSRLLPAEYPAVAAALLRRVASAMHAELLSSLSRADYEQMAGKCLEEMQAPLRLLDDLRSSRFLRITEDSVSFEHDLLRDYFVADELWRQNLPVDALRSELFRPKNEPLVEFVLTRIISYEDLCRALRQIRNPDQLDAAFEGRAGVLAQGIVKDDCARLFKAAVADLQNLTVGLKVALNFEGRLVLSNPRVLNHRTWSEYDGMLCGVIARHLDNPFLCSRFLELLGLTEIALRRATETAARESRLKSDSAWGEVVRVYGVLDGGTFALPLQRMLSTLRFRYRFSSKDKPPEALYEDLCKAVDSEPCPNLALLCLLELIGHRPIED